MRPPLKIVRSHWEKVIKENGGMVTLVAQSLGISRSCLNKYREKLPWVRKAFEDCEFRVTDVAEMTVRNAVEKNWKAAAWWLERKAKNRGFGKELKIESDEKPGVIHLHLPDDGRDPNRITEQPPNPPGIDAGDDTEE